MAEAYSLDLRQRAVKVAQREDLTRAEVARLFGIAEATLYEWLRRWRERSTLQPLPRGRGRRPVLDESGMQALRDIVAEDENRTIEEIRAILKERYGVEISSSALQRALKKL